jgi:hypothetical protein
MREATRVATSSTRLSVALLVVGVNRAASRRQMSTDVFVTSAVLCKTMNEDHDVLRLLRDPGPAKQQMAGRSGKVSLRSADARLFQT